MMTLSKKRITNHSREFSSPNSVNGFTLIEVLIAISLLTIVLGAVYSTFFSVIRALERFEDVSMKYHEARMALDTMRREVESAVLKNSHVKDPSISKTRFTIKDRDFFGKSASFLHLTAFSYRKNNVNSISYFVNEKDGTLSLFKEESPSLSQAKTMTVEIIEDIESFTIETLYNKKWVKTWDTMETAKLPDVVRLRVEFSDGEKKVSLTEYAKPKIGTKL